MARVEVPVTVLNSTTGLPVNGAAVAISHRATGSAATWYSAETGGTASTTSAVTDANGRILAWVDRGAYNLTISGTGVTTYTEPWDAVPGGDGSIDTLWLPDNVVTNAKVATGLDAGKLTTGTLPTARIAAASITGSQLASGTVTPANLSSPGSSGLVRASGTFVPTNVHQAVSWSGGNPSPVIATGQILLVDLVMDLIGGGNTISAALTVAGAEQASMSATGTGTYHQVYRMVTPATYVLSANIWATSSAGGFTTNSAIRWQIVNG